MAEVVEKISVALRLNNGYDSQGNTLYINESYPTINKANYTDARALAISSALTPVLDKNIEYVRKTQYSTITSE